MKVSARNKFLFIGDSITDAGRDGSGEETLWGGTGFGRGYVSLVNAWLMASWPGTPVRVVNQGISGHTVRDLKARWDKDVIAHQPDWLAVMIGINDVWRQFDTPLRTENLIFPAEYEKTLDDLLSATRQKLSGGLILVTPYMIEPNRSDPMRKRMDEYGEIVKKLAARHDALLVDTQVAFDLVLEHLHPMSLSWDRIHPCQAGHMVIAQAILKAIDAI